MKHRVVENKQIAPRIRLVCLTPLDKPLSFKAGQYVEFVVSEKELAPFSIANAPNPEGTLEFFIREDASDPLLLKFFPLLSLNAEPILRGPFGDCIYRPGGKSKVILLAGGVGLSQIKSILEEAIKCEDPRQFFLYVGCSEVEQDFFKERTAIFKQKLKSFNCVVESNPIDAALREFHDFSECEVYSSGPWKMTDEALLAFSSRGLNRSEVYSDRFSFL